MDAKQKEYIDAQLVTLLDLHQRVRPSNSFVVSARPQWIWQFALRIRDRIQHLVSGTGDRQASASAPRPPVSGRDGSQ